MKNQATYASKQCKNCVIRCLGSPSSGMFVLSVLLFLLQRKTSNSVLQVVETAGSIHTNQQGHVLLKSKLAELTAG